MSKQIRVLIVDDSAVVRQVLTSVLEQDPSIHVIGSCADPLFAMRRMNEEWPDVVVLDVEMPRMDGITFLKKIMAVRPTPVVICSTLTDKGARTTMDALSAGAVGIVTKPRVGLKNFLAQDVGDVIQAVKGAAAGDVRRLRGSAPPSARVDSAAGSPSGVGSSAAHSSPAAGSSAAGSSAVGSSAAPTAARALSETTDRVVAIGTSTGGTQALELVLRALPRVAPGIVVVQHMPEKFTAAFAERLDQICAAQVREARDGDRVLPGIVLIAPGGLHMSLGRSGAQYRVRVFDAPPVNRHKPSVDVLFRSVAQCAGRNSLGVIMTGMGDDGARGLLEMRDAGAKTVGQNEATCVVYGMPGEAVRRGAVEIELPLENIASAIQRFAAQG